MTKTAFGYTFGHPWRTTTGGRSADQPFPWPVTIGGVGFVLDLRHFQRVPPEAFRSAQDNGQEPGEGSLNPEGAWKRNRADWTLGAGQAYADDDGAFGFKSSPRRFLSSKGIDALTTRRELTLQHDTRLAVASVNASLQVLTCGAYVYLVDGSNLRFTTDPYAVSPSFTAVALGAAHSSNAVADGSTLWIADGTGVRKSTAGSGSTALIGNQGSTFAADRLGYANGWLIGAKDGRIAEISANGTMAAAGQLDFTHPAATWKWVGIVGAPNGIYAAGYSGDYSAIYFIGVDSSGKLTVPVLAAELARGTIAASLAYYGERLFVGTSAGFQIAEVLSSDGLALGPTIPLAHAVQCAEGQAAFIYFGWSNYDLTSSGIGKARLDEFVDQDVPGYCSDLMAGTAGATVQGVVGSVCTFAGKQLFTVDGVGLYSETATFVASGTIDTGWWTFGVFEPKAFSSVEVVTAPLVGTVAVAVVDDRDSITPLGVLSSPGSRNNGQVLPTGGVAGEQVRLQLTLSASVDRLSAPQVRRYTLRAMPSPAFVEAWNLPVILMSTVNAGPDSTMKNLEQDVRAKLAHLRDLMATQRAIVYQEGADSYRVVVRSVAIPDGFAQQWTPQSREAVEGTYMVKLVSVDVGS